MNAIPGRPVGHTKKRLEGRPSSLSRYRLTPNLRTEENFGNRKTLFSTDRAYRSLRFPATSIDAANIASAMPPVPASQPPPPPLPLGFSSLVATVPTSILKEAVFDVPFRKTNGAKRYIIARCKFQKCRSQESSLRK
jgi:hypothetical protein